VAGESVHPDGWHNQIDFERGGGHLHGPVAFGRFWPFSLPFANPRWYLGKQLWIARGFHMENEPLWPQTQARWPGTRTLAIETGHGENSMKSIGRISAAAMMLLLVFGVPAFARQDQQEKPKQQQDLLLIVVVLVLLGRL